MKKLLFAVALLLAAFYVKSSAQEKDNIVYSDASALPVFGKAYNEPGPRYRRLPESLHGVVRDKLWSLGCNSAGLYLRFRTDAPEIYAKWTNNASQMGHMTTCGIGGLDLYAYLDGEWHFVGSGFNMKNTGTDHQRRIVGNMEPQMREYMLYLSLYDEVKTLELGVPEGYTIEQPLLDSPRNDAPMVMYGTSILQGGCASRPGMAHTNILARRFNRTVINLGFSGNAFLDMEVAHLMADVSNPSVFVLDYVPNASADLIREKGEQFFRILRSRHPGVPVLFVEDPQFSHGIVDQFIANEIKTKNEAQLELFKSLQKAGEKNIYYVPARGMTTPEDFVDGIHLTDLGMLHYADHITPVIKKALRKSRL